MPRGPDDELLPWWWQRQVDPSSPDVVPGPGAALNTTRRNWTLLGTTGGAERAIVDPRGLVTPWPDGWSLDWWVGAEDTWHLPASAAGVRQRLVGSTPVVETLVRVPSGDLIHRAWAVAAGADVPDGGAVVVELENASPIPVAVAYALRPFNPLGRAPVTAITLDGTVVSVEGRPAIVLPKLPSRYAVGSAELDSVVPTIAGEAGPSWPDGGARCSAGRASAVFLFPLPHTATVRVMLPLVSLRPGAGRRRPDGAPADPRKAPDAARVVNGWEAQDPRRAPRLEVPEERLAEAVAAARCALLLHAAGDDVGSWPPHVIGGLDTAEVCLALDAHGLHAEAERLLLGFADRQGLDGSFAGESPRIDAPAAWLHAVGHHVRLTGDPSLAETLIGPVAKAAHLLRRRLATRRVRRLDGTPGLYPSAGSPSWLATIAGSTYHDALWARRGLLDAAFVLSVADQPDAAIEPRKLADELTATLLADLSGPDRIGAGPADQSTFGAVATAVALAATSSGPEAAETVFEQSLAITLDATPELVRGAVWHEVGAAGLSPRLTAWIGAARLAVGRADVEAPMRWLLERGGAMSTWPELVHPRSGGGCAGEGHHAASTAAVLQLTQQLLVHEAGAISVVSALPESWLGQSVEAHGVPTSHGRFSFALRWHGERPALLWELEPHDDPRVAKAVAAAGGFSVRAPGLDPTWSSTEPSGEALLAPPAPRPSVDDGPGPGPSESLPAPGETLDPQPPSGGASFS